jgi:hypothetical protein
VSGQPAVTREPRDRVHVDLVDVGALFAVDLDAHEQLVHERGGVGILERFVLHHVTPVARAIADRHEQRAVVAPGVGERLGTPRPPVDRVVHVLPEIGARLGGEPVGRTFARCAQGRLHYQPP